MKRNTLLTIVIMLGFIAWVWITRNAVVKEQIADEQTRLTYSGRVVALSGGGETTQVWIDYYDTGVTQKIAVAASRLDLTIGNKYVLVLNGRGQLISVELIQGVEKK